MLSVLLFARVLFLFQHLHRVSEFRIGQLLYSFTPVEEKDERGVGLYSVIESR